MNTCLGCGAETELYFHGSPVCVNCAEDEETGFHLAADALEEPAPGGLLEDPERNA